jgi:hypothetical protein
MKSFKTWHPLRAIFAFLWVLSAFAQPPAHVGPDHLYPDPQLTPGKAETLNVEDLETRYDCPPSIHKETCTYSQVHRHVTKGAHKRVYDEYNVPEEQRNIQSGEVDHLIPLCACGSNDIANLWYQPIDNEWDEKTNVNGDHNFGFKVKDDLEAWVCRELKAGRIDPEIAFERLRADWVAYYLEVKSKNAKSKGSASD